MLRIVYSSDSAQVKVSPLVVPSSQPTKLWLWKEETQTAIPFSLPEGALDPHLSSDYRLITFQRVRENGEIEIWVVDTQGCHARKLASVTLDEAIQRYAQFGIDIYLDLGWVPGTHVIVYHIQARGGVDDDGTYAQSTLVNAETGTVIDVLPLGEQHWLAYAPDGSQIAALTYDELRVYDTQTGQLQFSIPVSLKFGTGGHWYSPRGQYILVLSSAGFIGVNAANGTWREIPLAYEYFGGCGDAGPPPPDITWIDEASFFMLVPNSEQGGDGIECTFLFDDPTAAFTVWRIDLAHGTARPVNTFTGYLLSAVFSPDRQRLAFRRLQDGGASWEFQIVDVTSGRLLHTIDLIGNKPDVFLWNPDSTRFCYTLGDYPTSETPYIELYLGQIGGEPRLLGKVGYPALLDWVDADRLLVLDGGGLRLLSKDGEDIRITAISALEVMDFIFYLGD